MKINTDNKVVYTNFGSDKVHILSLEDAVRNGIHDASTVRRTVVQRWEREGDE